MLDSGKLGVAASEPKLVQESRREGSTKRSHTDVEHTRKGSGNAIAVPLTTTKAKKLEVPFDLQRVHRSTTDAMNKVFRTSSGHNQSSSGITAINKAGARHASNIDWKSIIADQIPPNTSYRTAGVGTDYAEGRVGAAAHIGAPCTAPRTHVV